MVNRKRNNPYAFSGVPDTHPPKYRRIKTNKLAESDPDPILLDNTTKSLIFYSVIEAAISHFRRRKAQSEVKPSIKRTPGSEGSSNEFTAASGKAVVNALFAVDPDSVYARILPSLRLIYNKYGEDAVQDLLDYFGDSLCTKEFESAILRSESAEKLTDPSLRRSKRNIRIERDRWFEISNLYTHVQVRDAQRKKHTGDISGIEVILRQIATSIEDAASLWVYMIDRMDAELPSSRMRRVVLKD